MALDLSPYVVACLQQVDNDEDARSCWTASGHHVQFCGDSFSCTTCGSSFDVGFDPPTPNPAQTHVPMRETESATLYKQERESPTLLTFNAYEQNGVVRRSEVVEGTTDDYRTSKRLRQANVTADKIRLDRITKMRATISSFFNEDPRVCPDMSPVLVDEMLRMYDVYIELYGTQHAQSEYLPIALRAVQLFNDTSSFKYFTNAIRVLLQSVCGIPIEADSTSPTNQLYVKTVETHDIYTNKKQAMLESATRVVIMLLHRVMLCRACMTDVRRDCWDDMLRYPDTVVPIVVKNTRYYYASSEMLKAQRPDAVAACNGNPCNFIDSVLKVHTDAFLVRDRRVLIHHANHNPSRAKQILKSRRTQMETIVTGTAGTLVSDTYTQRELANRDARNKTRAMDAHARLENVDRRIDDPRYTLLRIAYGDPIDASMANKYVEYLCNKDTQVAFRKANPRLNFVVTAFMWSKMLKWHGVQRR